MIKKVAFYILLLALISCSAFATSRIDRINGLTGGTAVKAPVDAVTTENITLSGAQTVNGVSLTADASPRQRVLVKDQTDATENGIYDVNSGAWTRSPDFDGARDAVDGTRILVKGSITYALSATNPVNIGTDELIFIIPADSIIYAEPGSVFFSKPDATETDQGVTGLGETIKAAVDAFGSNRGTILLQHSSGGSTTTYTLTTSETIPANITLKFENGAIIGGTGTLTVNGPIDAGRNQIFSDTITVAGTPIVPYVLSDWFSSVDQADAFGVPYRVSGSNTITAENLPNVEYMDLVKGATINNSLTNDIVKKDGDNVVGLHHNHLEESDASAPYDAITSGNIATPPIYSGHKQSDYRVFGHWYNDFGLDVTRGGASGSLSWYYWSWMFHGAAGDGYEAKRHPWLGFYRGDDANVLDWQCYWLNEAGVTDVVLYLRGTYSTLMDNWDQSSDENHWLYQLFNNTPNFKQLNYTLWVWSSYDTGAAEEARVEDSFTEAVEVCQAYPNFSYIEYNGGVYPIVFCFEGEGWRGAYDSYSGDTNTKAMLIAQAAKFQAAGFSGVAVFARTESGSLVGDTELIDGGVLYFAADYGLSNYDPSLNSGVDPAVDYDDLATGIGARAVTGFINPYEWTIANAMTDRDAHSYHPTTTVYAGSTPELFEKMLRNMMHQMSIHGNPRMFSIYNIAEWAEGGAALQPNMRDGKGYLEALRNALSQKPYNVTDTNNYRWQDNQFLAGPAQQLVIEEGATTASYTMSYSWAHTTTPFIDDPIKYHGKRIRLHHGESSAGTITLQDEGTLAGSELNLTAGTVAIGPGDSIMLEWDGVNDVWVQIGNVVNH